MEESVCVLHARHENDGGAPCLWDGQNQTVWRKNHHRRSGALARVPGCYSWLAACMQAENWTAPPASEWRRVGWDSAQAYFQQETHTPSQETSPEERGAPSALMSGLRFWLVMWVLVVAVVVVVVVDLRTGDMTIVLLLLQSELCSILRGGQAIAHTAAPAPATLKLAEDADTDRRRDAMN